ncbi:uncharacterized protein LOC115699677 [Cannabis sativa]|uniref:Cardiolipin synthase N-terminal domain-containing protein n=1 Tax=Cannabis sativa TaxID=3483 RepID=A0A7J6DST4_CANSA|nr:uncharacterized protein LOC115699677 [Cannabis sativa]KAF4349147.1 hypothetical protein G4B88_020386 [Cannabis sativa]
MLANASLISCNFSKFSSLTFKSRPETRNFLQTQNLKPRVSIPKTSFGSSIFRSVDCKTFILPFQQKGHSQICQSTLKGENKEDPGLNEGDGLENKPEGSGNVAEGRDWTTSILLFVLWGALLYYVFNLSPNQTPTRDMYFLKKLLNLKGDDGFRMNQVLVSLWYIMGLWPLVYSKLLLPTGRSSQSKIPVWPFTVLSFFGGAYALLPYFVLWKPPPPPVEETELSRWPLNFLESKITAAVTLATGLGLLVSAGLATGDDWSEFFQYFRESRFIHVTCIDFTLLSTFAPFWVYNDMTARKWFDKGSWLLFLSLVPFVGPALYNVLRPPLSALPATVSSTTSKPEDT